MKKLLLLTMLSVCNFVYADLNEYTLTERCAELEKALARDIHFTNNLASMTEEKRASAYYDAYHEAIQIQFLYRYGSLLLPRTFFQLLSNYASIESGRATAMCNTDEKTLSVEYLYSDNGVGSQFTAHINGVHLNEKEQIIYLVQTVDVSPKYFVQQGIELLEERLNMGLFFNRPTGKDCTIIDEQLHHVSVFYHDLQYLTPDEMNERWTDFFTEDAVQSFHYYSPDIGHYLQEDQSMSSDSLFGLLSCDDETKQLIVSNNLGDFVINDLQVDENNRMSRIELIIESDGKQASLTLFEALKSILNVDDQIQ